MRKNIVTCDIEGCGAEGATSTVLIEGREWDICPKCFQEMRAKLIGPGRMTFSQSSLLNAGNQQQIQQHLINQLGGKK